MMTVGAMRGDEDVAWASAYARRCLVKLSKDIAGTVDGS